MSLLPLGFQLCRPHTCQHCGAEVTEFATHGLNCRKSAGRHFRHAALNDIIHRGLISCTHSIMSRTIRPCPSRWKTSKWNNNSHGNVDNSLFGMPHALTPMLHLMQLLQWQKQGQQPTKQSAKKKKTKVCTPGPWPYLHTYSHRVFWCVWHRNSKRSWSSP